MRLSTLHVLSSCAGAASTAAATVRNMVQAWLLLQMQPDAAHFPLPESFKHTVQQVQRLLFCCMLAGAFSCRLFNGCCRSSQPKQQSHPAQPAWRCAARCTAWDSSTSAACSCTAASCWQTSCCRSITLPCWWRGRAITYATLASGEVSSCLASVFRAHLAHLSALMCR